MLKQLKPQMTGQPVQYIPDFDENIFADKNIKDSLKKYEKEYFFTKTQDWAYEQEWRVLVRSEEETAYLDLADSLIGVILNFTPGIAHENCVFASENSKLLEKIVPQIPLLEYGMFCGKANLRDKDANEW
ncbi:MAG: DUF2971 domain-containing protein [Bacteroides sp.]|nr:DUF2971 domain-containing protein [Bacteroides sp.]